MWSKISALCTLRPSAPSSLHICVQVYANIRKTCSVTVPEKAGASIGARTIFPIGFSSISMSKKHFSVIAYFNSWAQWVARIV